MLNVWLNDCWTAKPLMGSRNLPRFVHATVSAASAGSRASRLKAKVAAAQLVISSKSSARTAIGQAPETVTR